MPSLYIDADACPVRDEALRVALRLKVPLVMVSNGGIRPVDHALVRMVYVDQGADVADKWIAEHCGPGDVVVTTDIPLAARCIEKGAKVVKPDGSVLTDTSIGQALALRDLAADLRAADPFRPGSGKGFTARDRSRFAQSLDRLLGAAR